MGNATIFSEIQSLVMQKRDIDKKIKVQLELILSEYRTKYEAFIGQKVKIVGQKCWNTGVFERIDYRMSYDGQIAIVATIRNGSDSSQIYLSNNLESIEKIILNPKIILI